MTVEAAATDEAVQARLLTLLGGGLIDATYFCPEAPEARSPPPEPSPAPPPVESQARPTT